MKEQIGMVKGDKMISKKNNILIVAMVNEFDIVSFSGVYRYLKGRYGAKITLLIKRRARSLVPFLDSVDRVLFFDEDVMGGKVKDEHYSLIEKLKFLDDYIAELSEQHFDMIVNVSQCMLSAKLINALSKDEVVGITVDEMARRNIHGDWHQVFFSSVNADKYNDFSYYDLLTTDYDMDKKALSPYMRTDKSLDALYKKVEDRFEVTGQELVLINCAAKFEESTRWDLKSVISLANLLVKRGEKVVVLAGPEGKTALQYVASYVDKNVVCDVMTALDFAIFSKYAKVVISQTITSLSIPVSFNVPIIYLSIKEPNFREFIQLSEGSYVVVTEENSVEDFYIADLLDTFQSGDVERVLNGYDEALDIPVGIPEGLDTYLTKFDQDGFLTFKPIIKVSVTREELYTKLYREMWKVLLSEKDKKLAFSDFVDSVKDSFQSNEAMTIIASTKYDSGVVDILLKNLHSAKKILGAVVGQLDVDGKNFTKEVAEVDTIMREMLAVFNKNQFLSVVKFYFLILYEQIKNTSDFRCSIFENLTALKRMELLLSFLKMSLQNSSEIMFDDLNLLDEVVTSDISVVFN